ncbi:hypothetical protein DPMN_017904 [Dreissena polymorpha]|uniref:Uncharacterized protein n=1 Tax=Dreissena polymorpha TaxID=45954 RepID=A0A9D4NHF2_DREPO|nr:hypothetical protein DPMN_017904 [Dreissena polymorpha]
MVKQLSNKQSSTTIPTLIDNGTEASTNAEKADLVNNFFTKQSTVDNSTHTIP